MLEAGLRMVILLWKLLLGFWLFLSIGLSLLGFGVSGLPCVEGVFTLFGLQHHKRGLMLVIQVLGLSA